MQPYVAKHFREKEALLNKNKTSPKSVQISIHTPISKRSADRECTRIELGLSKNYLVI